MNKLNFVAFKKFFSKISVKIFFLNLFLSFIFFFFLENKMQFNFKVFICSGITSFLCWEFIEICSNLIKNKILKTIYFLLVSFLVTLLYVSTFFLFREFQNFINASMIKYVFDDYSFLFLYIKVYLFNLKGILFLVIWLGLFFGIFYKHIFQRKVKNIVKEIIKIILIIVSILVLLNQTKKLVLNKFRLLDESFLMGIKNLKSLEKQNNLKLYNSFDRLTVKKSESPSDFNILLIINESFNKYGLGIYGMKSEYAKFINDYLDSVKDRLVVFHNFYSNAGCTDVSIPSIMTGVSPENSLEKLHLLPLIWSYAKAKSMKSVFASAQNYNWVNFDTFLFSLPNSPDYFKTALDTNEPIIHDCGIDDLKAVKYFKKDLEKLNKDEKFLAIYNSNALHSPFQQSSKYLKNDKKSDFKYDNALYILDYAWKEIFDFFEEKNLLKDTIIIFTGDHSTPLTNNIVRLYSMKKDTLNIPFFIIFPEKFIKEHKDLFDNIKKNETVLASNIDIIPTIMTILNLEEKNSEIVNLLDGKSLFKDIKDRIVIMSNNTEFRRQDIELFAIYCDKNSFTFSTQEKEAFYDLEKDPLQKNNIWDEISNDKKEKIFDIIKNNKRLQEIYNEGKKIEK